MALVTVKGFDLQPSFGEGISRGLAAFQNFNKLGQQNLAIERDAKVREALSGIRTPEVEQQTQQQQMLAEQTAGLGGALAQAEQPQPIMSQEERIEIARDIDPAITNKMLKDLGLDTKSKLAEASSFAAKLEATPFEQRGQLIEQRIQTLTSQGRNASDSIQLRDMTEEQQNQSLLSVQLADLSTKERLNLKQNQRTLSAKRIATKDVKSSKIMDDGTIVSILKNGDTAVTSPSGELLEGQARVQAIKDAQEFGVDIQQRRSKARELGGGAGKVALDAFEAAGKMRTNIIDLQNGIDLIEKEGATTGLIADFMPNFKASTRKLQNLRNRLGLNVVSSVTFGALSAGELKLAMDTALPKGISEEETVNWIKERIAAQEKLADNLEDAALFLADNSVAQLIARNRAMAKSAKKKETTEESVIDINDPNITEEQLKAEIARLEGTQ